MKKLIGQGLGLLNQRNDLQKYNIHDFESLPPITRLFFYYYNVGNENLLNRNLLKEEMFCFPSSYSRIRNYFIYSTMWFEGKRFDGREYDYCVGEILKYEIINKKIENYKNGIKDIDEDGYILIGYMDPNGDWLMLGVEDYNRDQIFIAGSSFSGIQKIADNIFELFTLVTRYWFEEGIIHTTSGKFSGKDVYLKWGEIEWMVRGHEPEKEDWEKNETLFLKAGLGLLKQRNDNPKILEMLLKKLPFRASIFYKYYNTGNYEDMINFVPYRLDLPDGTQGLVVEDRWFEQMPDINYRFGRLLSLEELAEEFDKYAGQKEEYHKTGFVQIGEMQNSTIKILLGIAEDVMEQIMICDESGHHKNIANDIFHFFTFVNRYWSDKDIVKATNGAKTGEDLYQNWGENFWRVI